MHYFYALCGSILPCPPPIAPGELSQPPLPIHDLLLASSFCHTHTSTFPNAAYLYSEISIRSEHSEEIQRQVCEAASSLACGPADKSGMSTIDTNADSLGTGSERTRTLFSCVGESYFACLAPTVDATKWPKGATEHYFLWGRPNDGGVHVSILSKSRRQSLFLKSKAINVPQLNGKACFPALKRITMHSKLPCQRGPMHGKSWASQHFDVF